MHEYHTTTTLNCPFEMPDGERCGDELEIEWRTYPVPSKQTYLLCRLCGQPQSVAEPRCTDFETGADQNHDFVETPDDDEEHFELVSFKTYCFHPLTECQIGELLNDHWVGLEEQRAER